MNQTLEAPRAAELTPEPLYQLALGFATTKTLLAASKLGLFDQLALGPQSADEAAKALGLHTESTEMLLDACAALRLCVKGAGRYTNAPIADRFLVQGRPGYLGRFLNHFNDHMYPVWFYLEEAVRTGKAQVNRVLGQGQDHFFKAIQRQGADLETFMLTMEEHSLLEGAALTRSYDFSQHRRMLDVAGGTGAMSVCILKQFPHLSATVFDQPEVCPITERCLKTHGMEKAIVVCPGNMHEDVLPGPVDLVLLSAILHNWGPDKARNILRRCAGALEPKGTLLISEQVLADSRTEPLPGVLCSLNMMVMLQDAREYSRREFQDMLTETGFDLVEIKPTGAARQLLVARKR